MIFQCNECWKQFDADTEPEVCPYCGSAGNFAQITITNKYGRKLTYKEHIEELRKYYLAHPPRGINRKRILEMSEEGLEDMADVMDEISNDTWDY